MKEENSLELIKKIIFKYIESKSTKIFLFGSRAEKTHGIFSDFDIGLESDKKLNPLSLEKIRWALEDSNLPYSVDVVDFSKLSENFKLVAKKHVIYLN